MASSSAPVPVPAPDPAPSPLPSPQFESEQVTEEPADVRWEAWKRSDGQTISIYNVCGQLIIVIPLEWALEAEFTTFAALSPIVDLMFETDSDTPLVWATKAKWDETSGAGLLPMDASVESADYVVYRNEFPSTGLIPSHRWGPPVASGLESGVSTTSSSSLASTSQSQSSHERARVNTFRTEVLQRDGSACVLSGMLDGIEAAHLVNRGDTAAYAAANIDNRPLTADDTRAGVTLYGPLHTMYDKYEAAFYPSVSKVEVTLDGVKQSREEVTFTFHIFRPPLIHPDGSNVPLVKLLMGFHGKKVTWMSTRPTPSVVLARVSYQRTLLKRFAVIRRAMAPPSARKRAPSSPATPPLAKKNRPSTPREGSADVA